MSIIATPGKAQRCSLVLLAALVLETMLLGGLYYNCRTLEMQVPYAPHEQPLIEQAINIYARRHRLPVKTVMQGRFPLLARTAAGKCVNIRAYKGRIGSVVIVCFDHQGKLTHYEER